MLVLVLTLALVSMSNGDVDCPSRVSSVGLGAGLGAPLLVDQFSALNVCPSVCSRPTGLARNSCSERSFAAFPHCGASLNVGYKPISSHEYVVLDTY